MPHATLSARRSSYSKYRFNSLCERVNVYQTHFSQGYCGACGVVSPRKVGEETVAFLRWFERKRPKIQTTSSQPTLKRLQVLLLPFYVTVTWAVRLKIQYLFNCSWQPPRRCYLRCALLRRTSV